MIFDTYNLKNEVEFKIKLSNDLYWVPSNILGRTKYSNREMEKFDLNNLNETKKKITCLYELIQFYQIHSFEDKEDVYYRYINNKKYEFHVSGQSTMLNRTGCCSSTASMAKYILKDNYDKIGFLSFSRPDGSGHVFNYIFEKNEYFIFDLTAHNYLYKSKAVIETGKKHDIFGKNPTSMIYQTSDLKNFVKYHHRLQKTNKLRFIYFDFDDDFDEFPPMNVECLHDKVKINFFYDKPLKLLNNDYNDIYTVETNGI